MKKIDYKAFDYLLGSELINRLHLFCGAGRTVSIDYERLGYKMRVGREMVIMLRNYKWILVNSTEYTRKKAFGHGYIIRGDKVRPIGMHKVNPNIDAFEAFELGARIENGRAMFKAGMGERSKKRVKAHVNRGGTIGNTIVTKRFDGSRLTCVCKSKVY